MSDQVAFFMPITKKEMQADGSVIVTGYASTPTKDLDGEIISLDAVKSALPAYMEWRNIRAMHQPEAVGVTKEANVDDVGLFIRGKIIDPGAVLLVKEEVYKGFSIGGRKLAKTGDTITDLELIEISLVDRPANPDCRFAVAKGAKVINPKRIDLIKAVDAKPRVDPAKAPIELDREDIGLFGKLLLKLSGAGSAASFDKRGATSVDAGKTAEVIRPAATEQPDPSSAGQEGEGVDKREVSDKERADLADKGHAMPDGSFPIKTKDDLENAVTAHGRAKDPASVKRHIVRQAKRLGATDSLPEDWPSSTKGKDAAKIAKGRADFYTVSNLISLLGQLEWAEECCEGDGCSFAVCSPYPYGSNGSTSIDPGKDFTDKFGAVLVQFGDLVAELLGKVLAEMKAEEASEALAAMAKAYGAARDGFQKQSGTALAVTDGVVVENVMTQLAVIAKRAGGESRPAPADDVFAKLKQIGRAA